MQQELPICYPEQGQVRTCSWTRVELPRKSKMAATIEGQTQRRVCIRWVVLDTSETGYILQVNVMSRRICHPILSMPCPPCSLSRATTGPFQSCEGTNIKPMHARSAMQQLPNPFAIKLIPHNAFIPSHIIRHHVVPNSLKASACLESSWLIHTNTHIHTLSPSYLTQQSRPGALRGLLQQGTHDTSNSSQQAAGADGEVGGRVGGRA